MIQYIKLFFCTVIVCSFAACAQKGNPTGGPKDETPPKLVKSVPDTFSTGVDVNTPSITLSFDEYVILKDYVKQVLISPPIDPSPIFLPTGVAAKEVKVEFNAPLKENTTYTINFGESIQDNNENNKLSFFNYVFSTGEYIDSLELKGQIKRGLEKTLPENLVAALYKIDTAYSDSLLLREKPFYVAKVDSAGRFLMKHLHQGDYQMVVFDDETPNLLWDAKTEKMGFVQDTLSLPKNLSDVDVSLFQAIPPYQALEGAQNGYGRIDFYFDGKPEEVEIMALNDTFSTAKIIHKPQSDTLQFWFNPAVDSLLDKKPRLKFAVKHAEKIDSLPSIGYDKEHKHALVVNARSLPYAPGSTYEIQSNYPLDSIRKEHIKVLQDSTMLDFELKKVNDFKFTLDFEIDYNKLYQIDMNANAVTDFFGKSNDSITYRFKTKGIRDYGNIKLTLQNAPKTPFWIKLYKKNDTEVKSIYTTETVFEFKNLLPDDYYFKILVDENENQKWDTGDFFLRQQPEKVYHYPEPITVRAYWDMDETWVLD